MANTKANKKVDHSMPRPASFIPSNGPAIGLPSPLGTVMSGQKSGSRRKKSMDTPLLLTALVDAFSILVIFLLVQMGSGQNFFEANDSIKLPQASSVDVASPSDKGARIANLVVTERGYILDEEVLNLRDVGARLKAMGSTAENPVRLVIQADQASNFDLMSPLLSLTAEVGISKLEFAVEEAERAM
ncbi:MAG: biopolymer transporter ExbD [Bdellovibrionales bacterium]|jgi:biopolymer transport protein ExbD|nr:biopolymer transporter ExbD [Bdellovibrionales bacterium]